MPINVIDKKTGEVIAGPGKTKKRESIRDRLKQLTPAEKGFRRKNPYEYGESEKAKPHSTEKGRIASGKRKIRRILATGRPKGKGPGGGLGRPQPGPGGYDPPKRPETIMTPALRAKKAGGGTVTRFRSSGPEGKPHSTKEGRSAEAQRAYMRQHGPQEPRRKRIWPKRVKKGNGGSMQQHYLQHGYGPHKIQLRSGKPKLAKKGW